MKLSKLSEWWAAPQQKKTLKNLLFGNDTLRFCGVVLAVSLIVISIVFIMQMCSVEDKVEDTVAFIGVSVIFLSGLWQALSNMRMLKEIWEKIVYGCLMVVLGYLIFQLSIWLFIAFIFYLVCCLFGLAKIDVVKALFPETSSSASDEPEEISNYGSAYHGVNGDYILGQHGDEQRITDDLGGGYVRTDKGERYHIDNNGHATKL